ncbi:uncharacterized protein N7529_005287 [Penicillium soppii]|jgi:hypothetical protein|uniref:uncharacterized protein n=1 Tax=Penicillium soppii TaxID=69789 RepID=UPI002549521B|nr:uncharacterized protein N7529_005287 [Penicillium soppii]KAJ5872934.1 hypothetical protein N7529_005287 [Penicillium soppii]
MDSIPRESTKYELSDLDRLAPPMMVKAFLLYKLSSDAYLDKLITSLEEGLKNAVFHMPFMEGCVQKDEFGKPYIQTSSDSRLRLSVRCFSQTEHKSYSALVDSSFPVDDLDHIKLLPELPAGQQQVGVIQLNVIPGGVILGFAIHHAVGDWTSMDAFLSLICRSAKAHQYGDSMPVYTPDLNRFPFNAEKANSTTSQKDLLDKCPGFFVVDMKAPPATASSAPPPSIQTKIYRASDSAVQNIKQQCTSLEGVDYITSYDCIAALLWTSITRARLHRHPEKHSSQSISANPINLRSRDPENSTSQEYFGNAVLPSWVGPVDVQLLLADNGISIAASLIRKSINASTVASIKDLARLVRSLSPSERLGIPMDFHKMDLLMNSWYSGKAENYDIGTGFPFAFRTHRPNTGACCLILPNFSRSSTRVYEIFVQLPAEEHDLLREDPIFSACFELLC